MTELALRDHIVEMLDAIATDLDTVQSAADQDQKAKGKTPRRSTEDTAAEIHAGLREVHGFTIDQLLSEYRALRASVLRLWIEAFPSPDRTNLVDIMNTAPSEIAVSVLAIVPISATASPPARLKNTR